jgi:hypothetical protein
MAVSQRADGVGDVGEAAVCAGGDGARLALERDAAAEVVIGQREERQRPAPRRRHEQVSAVGREREAARLGVGSDVADAPQAEPVRGGGLEHRDAVRAGEGDVGAPVAADDDLARAAPEPGELDLPGRLDIDRAHASGVFVGDEQQPAPGVPHQRGAPALQAPLVGGERHRRRRALHLRGLRRDLHLGLAIAPERCAGGDRAQREGAPAARVVSSSHRATWTSVARERSPAPAVSRAGARYALRECARRTSCVTTTKAPRSARCRPRCRWSCP